jgi:adenosylmethionine-8-amino-7-oxononanoate aminotransferase
MDNLIKRDLAHVWHPCTQMKDFETCPPLIVERASGSYLYTNQGPIIDGIASWWCKSLGHGHPRIKAAIAEQLERFEHVITANTTHPKLVALAEALSEITQKQHVFFASDGATAVEIAMKLALHAMQLQGKPKRNQFIALSHAYHGESFASMSVSDLGLYTKPYSALSLSCHFIHNVPYVADEQDPLWTNCESAWQAIEPELERLAEKTCAVIFEPLVQGAGGMRSYSADFLKRLTNWAKSRGIYCIADEIMTGMGRLGEWLACHKAEVVPDLICLSKGLTSGSLPLSCVMIGSPIYDLFYNDYLEGKSFLHSNTYSGNPLAVCAALATIETMQAENTLHQAKQLGILMRQHFNTIAEKTGKLSNIRGLGAIVAADLAPHSRRRVGDAIYQEALQQGALIRPMGHTLYWLPPLNTDEETIGQLAEITLHSINKVYKTA